MSRESRRGYEFPKGVRESAWRKYKRESGNGANREDYDLDHIAPIYACRRAGVDPNLVKAPVNARYMKRKDHQARDHFDEEEVGEAVQKLKKLQPRLIPWDEEDW